MEKKLKLQVLDSGYLTDEKNRPVLYLLCSDENKRKVVVLDESFKPYFYAIPNSNDEKDVEEAKDYIKKAFEKNYVLNVEILEKVVNLKKRKILKIIVDHPSNVPKLREVIGTLPFIEELREYDILFHRRYLVDNAIEPMDWYEVEGEVVDPKERYGFSIDADEIILKKSMKRLYLTKNSFRYLAFDLETIEDGETKIIMASVFFDNGKGLAITYKDINAKNIEVVKVANELGIIKKLVEVIKNYKPHFIITYNGDAFDMKVLKDRCKKYKMELCFDDYGISKVKFKRKGRTSIAEVPLFPHIDLFAFVSNIMFSMLDTEVLSLEAVSQEILGEGKYDVSWEEIEYAWRNNENLEKVAEYCIRDSELTIMLFDALSSNIFSLSALTYLTPFDVTRSTYSNLVESFAIRKAFKANYVVPNRPSHEEMEMRRESDTYEGAIVIEPKPGLHENIAVFDFRSLYPSIIVTHNIDPDTINCSCCDRETGHAVPGKPYYFCKKIQGFIPSILKELIEKRVEIKKKLKEIKEKDKKLYKIMDSRQKAMKTVANAFYGYLAFVGSRFYDKRCAESVTAFGRHYIKTIVRMAEAKGFEIIYGDTDSIFLKIDGKTKKDSFAFLKEVNEFLPGIIELDFQGFYKRGIFVPRKLGGGGAKKRYALIDENGNLVIRGFERVRRDWSKLARKTQEIVLRLVLENKVNEAINYVKKTIEDLRSGKVSKEDLCIYTTLTKSPDKYDQIGPHVAAAKKAMARGIKIRPGETIKYIITKKPGSISDKAELDIFADSYDPEYYIKHQVLPAAMRVLGALGIKEGEILGKGKQVNLFSFK